MKKYKSNYYIMDWKKIYNILDNKNNKLDDYKLLEYKDLMNINRGSHIKFIKNDKILNGGFLIDIIYNESPLLTILILKTNIIWKLYFYKYKIYIKNIKDFNNKNKMKNILYNKLILYENIIT